MVNLSYFLTIVKNWTFGLKKFKFGKYIKKKAELSESSNQKSSLQKKSSLQIKIKMY